MKYWFFLLLSMGVINCPLAQIYSIGHRTETFIDPDRQNRLVPTELYYPSSVAGDNVPVAGETGVAFPVIIFGHGFVMEWGAYANFWNALVPRGYILAFPKTETGISPDHTVFGQDIAFLVKVLQEQGVDPASFIYNKVDTTSCVMGHSMGGGASFLSVQFNPEITAVVNFAAAETNPSAVDACGDIELPVLMFAGANDCITPPETNQELMYDALLSSCKTLVTITGASHCQFAEQNLLCSFGELTCTPAPDISRAAQHQLVDTLLIPWLDYHLKLNCLASEQFQNVLISSNELTFQQACEPCFPVHTEAIEPMNLFRAYPVPSLGALYLQADVEDRDIDIRVLNGAGRSIYQQTPTRISKGLWQVNPGLIPGIYFLEIQYSGQIETIKIVVQ